MVVTIFTDASYSRKAGGWAAWIKFGPAPHQTIRLSASFKARPCSSNSAELAAIANALHVAARRLGLKPGDLVVLQSDCLGAMDIIANRATKALKRPYVAQCKASIDATQASFGFRLDLRHVRGHQGKVDKRSAVNEWCDQAAKAEMRRKRDEPRPKKGKAAA